MMRHFQNILRFMALVWIGVACAEDPQLGDEIRNALRPDVRTADELTVTASTVTVAGEVTRENGAPVREAGFCWGTSADFSFDPEMARAVAEGKGTFETTIDGLRNNTLYYIRAYAINEVDTAYGDVLQFTTNSGVGTVRTFAATHVGATSAVCGGVITKAGEAPVSERGLYLMRGADSLVVDSIIPIRMEADSFYTTIERLEPLTRYYVRAYARNEFGEFNGSNLVSFTTSDGMPILSGLKNVATSYTFADFSFTIESEGDSPVTVCGLCYGTEPEPTLETADTLRCGSGTGTFEGRLTELRQQTQYYVRAFATNAMGTRYSEGQGLTLILLNELPTVQTVEIASMADGQAVISCEVLAEGASDVTESGIVWNSTANATVENHLGILPVSYGATKYDGVMSDLRGGTTYYVRAYAINANGTQYGQYLTVRTPEVFQDVARFTGAFRRPNSSGFAMIDDNLCYLLGGDRGPGYTDELWMFVADERDTWQQLASQPEELAWQACFSRGFGLWAFGGMTADGTISDRLYFYSSLDNTWSAVSEDAATRPAGRYRSATVVHGERVYLIGGRRDSLTNEVWSFDSDRYAWTRQASFPIRQSDGVAISLGGRVYAGLGRTNPDALSATYTKKLWSSSDLSNWSEETEWPGSTGIQQGFTVGGALYAIDTEGYVWRYDVSNKTWTRGSQLPSDQRDTHCVFVVGDRVLIGLGKNSDQLIEYEYTWDN